jgi:predicted regulator of Ras-like GTPase activity (Roadblock/LC7/MglB family)
MVKKRKETEETVITEEPVAVESAVSDDRLRTSLEEIKNYDGVMGYIMRNTTSASIDLKDPAKIVDYAILSSTAFEATEEFSQLFELGNLKNITVDGKNLRMLSLAVDENKISVFMEKNADVEKIMKRIHAV